MIKLLVFVTFIISNAYNVYKEGSILRENAFVEYYLQEYIFFFIDILI
jgi:hypothetical protein